MTTRVAPAPRELDYTTQATATQAQQPAPRSTPAAPLTQDFREAATPRAAPTAGVGVMKATRPAAAAPALPSVPPAQQPAQGQFGPGNDQRFTTINGSFTPQHSGAIMQNMNAANVGLSSAVGQARDIISGASIKPFQTVAGPDYSASKALINGATANPFESVAGPDFSAAIGDLNSASGNVDQAQVGQLRDIAAGSYGNSPEAIQAREIAMSILQGINSTPNRTDIAQQKLDIFNERSNDTLTKQLQQTGQASAALGRLGSGMVRDDLRSAVTNIDKERALTARELAAETAGLELSDQLNKLNAGLTAGGQFRTEDLNDASMGINLRNEDRAERGVHAARESEQAQLALARAQAQQAIAAGRGDLASRTHAAAVGERDTAFNQSMSRAGLDLNKAAGLGDITGREHSAAVYERDADLSHSIAGANLDLNKGAGLLGVAGAEHDVGIANAGLAMQRAGLLRGLDNDEFGRGVTLRDEQRGERAYQYGVGRDAINDAERQVRLEEDLKSSDFNRQMDYIQTLMGGGNYDPTGVLGGAADAAGQNSANAMDAFAQWAYQRAAGGN